MSGAKWKPRVNAVLAEIEAVLDDGGRGERLRDGVIVAIAGPPNAGKSTLLNLLARREAAIVSPFAGTTRDPVEVHLELGGVPVTLVDTAGLREGSGAIEAIGRRSCHGERVAEERSRALARAGHGRGERGSRRPELEISCASRPSLILRGDACPGDARDQRRDGDGYRRFARLPDTRVQELAGADESVLITRARQRSALLALRGGTASLSRASNWGRGASQMAIELQAEHLRRASSALGAPCRGKSMWRRFLARDFCGFLHRKMMFHVKHCGGRNGAWVAGRLFSARDAS